MSNLNLKYHVEDKPSIGKLLLFGLQWLAVAIPMIIYCGKSGCNPAI
jgi:hypothetical protein